LEERVGSTVKAQHIWSPVYVDGLILRDRDANGTPGDGPHGSNLEERVYVQQDANWNVTALVDPSGAVVERYVYDPYGQVARLTSTWGTPSTDPYAFANLHQGGRWDSVVNLYHFRNGDLSPVLGRWLQNDPITFAGGDTNLYRYVTNGPASNVDAEGLQKKGNKQVKPVAMPDGSTRWIPVDPGQDPRTLPRGQGGLYFPSHRPEDYYDGPMGPYIKPTIVDPAPTDDDLDLDDILDGLQACLDFVGLIDPSGIVDGINSVFSGLRGETLDAAVRAAAMLPAQGLRITPYLKHHRPEGFLRETQGRAPRPGVCTRCCACPDGV
jgi:RHS repeat-associated protein